MVINCRQYWTNIFFSLVCKSGSLTVESFYDYFLFSVFLCIFSHIFWYCSYERRFRCLIIWRLLNKRFGSSIFILHSLLWVFIWINIAATATVCWMEIGENINISTFLINQIVSFRRQFYCPVMSFGRLTTYFSFYIFTSLSGLLARYINDLIHQKFISFYGNI